MILDAFHTGQTAAIWLLAATLGFASAVAPVGLLGWALSRLRLPHRARASIIERRTRRRS